MATRVFGIRHHGPGSARAVGHTLLRWRPDVVLVEGPPEADPILHLAADPEMRPPVALLAYKMGEPGNGLFYPLAEWSPEWVAIRYALASGVPVRMIDLTAAAMLTIREDRSAPDDPIGRLAEAAGYDDPERWWEDVIEHRPADDDGPWDAIADAMATLRDGWDPPPLEARREASMRRHIGAAERDGFTRIAVVCGAWHAPALTPPRGGDRDLLKNLPRDKTAVTWIPWTTARLAFASGYGAGVASPGWYEHLYRAADLPVLRWLSRVATMLRTEDLDAPPASVVDAVRLAEALATLRGRPLAGLSECTDAARAVLAGGSDVPLQLIHRRLVVGEAMGEVPAATPMVPLAADLAALQRRLRLRPESVARSLDLDLRKPTDLGRSHLLHRLDLLEVKWGVQEEGGADQGTFHERWSIGWAPELSLRVIEASVWGSTVESAASARAVELSENMTVSELTRLIERTLLAELAGAVPVVMRALADRAVVVSDATEVMDALAPLARVLRYGNVRRTGAAAIEAVVRGLVARAAVGLGPACAGLGDEAAAEMTTRIDATDAAVVSLDDSGLQDEWRGAVRRLVERPGLHGLIAGRSCRILLDSGILDAGIVVSRLSAALSRGEDPARGAAWVEGFVAGSAMVLLHDHELLDVIDGWVSSVVPGTFDDVLPLLRRAFSRFPPGERRLLGERLRRGTIASPDVERLDFDPAHAAVAIPTLRLLLRGEQQSTGTP